MDVGLELQRARERRGLSLLDLSQITKIRPHVLQAIEASDEDRLPAPVFTRSFVKTYAAEVRLDPEDTLRRYLEQFEPPPEVPSPAGSAAEPEAVRDEEPPQVRGRLLHGRFASAIVLVLVGIAAFTLARVNGGETPPATAPAEAAAATDGGPTGGTRQAQPETVGTSGLTPAPADALALTIAPTGPCWVQASVNGAPVFAGLLTSGDQRSVQAAAGITLRIGDPATFAFSINGKPAKITGVPGQAVTVLITRDNYVQFLARL